MDAQSKPVDNTCSRSLFSAAARVWIVRILPNAAFLKFLLILQIAENYKENIKKGIGWDFFFLLYASIEPCIVRILHSLAYSTFWILWAHFASTHCNRHFPLCLLLALQKLAIVFVTFKRFSTSLLLLFLELLQKSEKTIWHSWNCYSVFVCSLTHLRQQRHGMSMRVGC